MVGFDRFSVFKIMGLEYICVFEMMSQLDFLNIQYPTRNNQYPTL